MSRFILSTSIGLLCAGVFTFLRGGWHDTPLVIPVFAIGGFVMSYVVFVLIDLDRLVTNRLSIRGNRKVLLVRNVVATMIIASTVYWSGPLIQAGGYGGWLVAIFLGITLPLIVCLVVSRAEILCGLLTATAILVSLVMNQHNFRVADWLQFVSRDLTVWTIMWFILLVLSLISSVPLVVQRSRKPKC